MNIREIIEIRDKLKNELSVVEKFLEIAKRQGLANGDTVDKKLKLDRDAQPLLTDLAAQDGSGGGYGAIGKSVWEAIKLCPLEFTVTDVGTALKDLDSSVSKLQISTAIARLNRQKRIQTIDKKRGRKPAIYRRTNG
jgi:hypothetical protein